MRNIFIFLILITLNSCKKKLSIDKSILFEIELKALKNDNLQFFYSNDIISEFKEVNSLKFNFTGSPNKQKVKFILPKGLNPNRIRIDLSDNVNQNKIILYKICIHLDNKIITFNEKSLRNMFVTNDCISFESNTYNLFKNKNTYDPYIISKNLNSYLNLLIE